MSEEQTRQTLDGRHARLLSNTTKTPAQWAGITPRWLVSLLQWVPVEAGVYRVNRVRDIDREDVVKCSPFVEDDLPETYIDYEDEPREYTLNAVTSVLDVQTRVSDLYRSPFDQVQEQLRLLVEKVKERQEFELINSTQYGLLTNAPASQRLKTRKGPPTPDDLDALLAKVWKEPSYFVAHPEAIAAFGRECTRRGVPPPTVNLFGAQFITWRGIPLIPSDKLQVDAHGKTNILLLRVGEQKQGVIGLFQPGLAGEVSPSLSVKFMGINRKAIASYLISLYCSAAILTEDAIAVLEDVDVRNYYDYS